MLNYTTANQFRLCAASMNEDDINRNISEGLNLKSFLQGDNNLTETSILQNTIIIKSNIKIGDLRTNC